MANVIENTNHPCYGMDCKDCETCIFDVDLFKEDKNMKNTCNNCKSLVKNYVGDGMLQFDACCSRCMVTYSNYSLPRNIRYKTGHMVDIETPDWCPKARGVTKEYKSSVDIAASNAQTAEKKPLTYMEKKERLMNLPRSTEWEDIKEGDVYVIPKVLSSYRKVVRVVIKTDTLIRCSDIDEFGKESQVCTSIYKSDIDSHFMKKVHKY